MTFDFAPGWLDGLFNAHDYASPSPTPPRPLPAAPARPAAMAVVAPCAPAHPTPDQMARLVGELFTEGSLSFEQLCSLSNVPELSPLLGDAVAGAAPARRKPQPPRR